MNKLKIINTLTKTLVPEVPMDPLKFQVLDQQLPKAVNAHFSFVNPEKLPEPFFISVNKKLCQELGIEDLDLNILTGNKYFENSMPWALCYGGHQFGFWAGQLGDGRAISLAQIYENEKIYELQLKGAGIAS